MPEMKMLPEKSRASFKDGIWFVFHDGINSLKIYGSSLGKEKVFLNEVLVSEQRNLNLNSEHSFSDKTGNVYNVVFETTKLMNGEMECRVLRNGEKVKVFRTKIEKGKNLSARRLVIVAVFSVAFALFSKHMNLPGYALYLFFLVVLIVHFITRQPSRIIILE
jgi:hypothetical protein